MINCGSFWGLIKTQDDSIFSLPEIICVLSPKWGMTAYNRLRHDFIRAVKSDQHCQYELSQLGIARVKPVQNVNNSAGLNKGSGYCLIPFIV
jgi:hypothetical protein